MRQPFRDEAALVIKEFSLPPLPDYDDGPGYRDLVLFTQGGTPVILAQCSLADARGYCSREDAHGPDWFVGFSVPEGPEPDDADEDGLTF